MTDRNRFPRSTGYRTTRPISRMQENTRRRWCAESAHRSLVGSRGLDPLQNSLDLPFLRLDPVLVRFDLLVTSRLAGQSFSRSALRGIGQRIGQPLAHQTASVCRTDARDAARFVGLVRPQQSRNSVRRFSIAPSAPERTVRSGIPAHRFWPRLVSLPTRLYTFECSEPRRRAGPGSHGP
jgi:hypothetical protein